MADLTWGMGVLETTPSINGAPGQSASWTQIDTPQENTLKLTPTAGTRKQAIEEGGGIVGSKKGKNTFVLEFDLFVKKGVNRPFQDNDGQIDGHHAFRYTPEDSTTEGFLIENSEVSCEERFSTEEGKMLHYVVDVQKPASGNALKPYGGNNLTVDKTELYFSNAADTTGKTVTATSTGNVTASSSESWCTVTTSGKTTTVKVTSHTGSAPREALVTITADGKTASVKVLQIP